MSLLEGLRFTRGDTFIHRADPRSKFLFTLLVFSAALIYQDIIPLLIIMGIQIPLIVMAGIQREWLKSLKGGAFLALVILATNLLSYYFFNNRTLTYGQFETTLGLTIRFLVLITSFSLFFLTTSPDDLSLALEKARIPYEFNFAFITAIRFVPVLADEAQSIMDAQRSRGLELDKGSFLNKVRNYIPILLPLIINSIRRSLELAEAMESRAFGSTQDRTNLYELNMKSSDRLIIMFTVLAFIGLILANLYLPRFPKIWPQDVFIIQ